LPQILVTSSFFWHLRDKTQFETHRGVPYVILGFSREVAENCTLLGYYADSGGNFLPTSHYSLSNNPEEHILSSGLSFTTLNNGDMYGRTSGRNRSLLPEQWACCDMPLHKKKTFRRNEHTLTNESTTLPRQAKMVVLAWLADSATMRQFDMFFSSAVYPNSANQRRFTGREFVMYEGQGASVI
jgi:hypothetical protein